MLLAWVEDYIVCMNSSNIGLPKETISGGRLPSATERANGIPRFFTPNDPEAGGIPEPEDYRHVLLRSDRLFLYA